jgi:hypothetical protein
LIRSYQIGLNRKCDTFERCRESGYVFPLLQIEEKYPIIDFKNNDLKKNQQFYNILEELGYSKMMDNLEKYNKKYEETHPVYDYKKSWKENSNLGKIVRRMYR